MLAQTKVRDWLGCEMKGFFVRELYAVYDMNKEGMKTGIVRYFLRDEVATRFMGENTSSGYREKHTVTALTDGKRVFVFDNAVIATGFLLDEEAEVNSLRQSGLEKLSKGEKEALGVGLGSAGSNWKEGLSVEDIYRVETVFGNLSPFDRSEAIRILENLHREGK
ncbi:MAG TPA: hypothetical protein PLV72_02870 [Candidatus Magasanikbacteria bacterium]|nr:hypothetical protein [Candidatus Magasanikbacteria bacterium]